MVFVLRQRLGAEKAVQFEHPQFACAQIVWQEYLWSFDETLKYPKTSNRRRNGALALQGKILFRGTGLGGSPGQRLNPIFPIDYDTLGIFTQMIAERI